MAEPVIVGRGSAAPGSVVAIDPATASLHYTRTDDTWTPRTYADELSERGEDSRVRVRCGCGRTRPAWVVIDVRALPPEIRGTVEWACDACRTEWMRSPRNPLTGAAELVERLGGPAVVVERLRAAKAGQR